METFIFWWMALSALGLIFFYGWSAIIGIALFVGMLFVCGLLAEKIVRPKE